MNGTKFVNFLKNKNTVTALAALIIVTVLVLGYNVRVNQATTPVNIPYARVTIQPGTQIDESMIAFISIPAATIKGDIVKDRNGIIGKYSKDNTIIPAGSFFYTAALTPMLNNSEDVLANKVAKGETLNYITVDMLSTYSNSIVPGNYIDIYASAKYDNKNKVAKLFSNIKVLEVRTADGKPVFGSSAESRVPYVIFFGLPKEEDMILKMIHSINSWGGGVQDNQRQEITNIKLKPIPTTVGFDTNDKESIKVTITSPEMVEKIKYLADDLSDPEADMTDVNVVDDNDINIDIDTNNNNTNTNANNNTNNNANNNTNNNANNNNSGNGTLDDLLGGE